MLIRYSIGVFFFCCIIATVVALAWGGIGYALEALETRKVEAAVGVEQARVEQIVTQGDNEQQALELEKQLVQARSELVQAQGFLAKAQAEADSLRMLTQAAAAAVNSNTQIVYEVVTRQAETIRREEGQEDWKAFIKGLWDRYTGCMIGILIVIVLAGLAVGKKEE